MKIAAKKIADLWRRLCKSRLGNVTIIFAFAMPVVLIAAGGAVDYGQALTVRSQLRDATDAAAVGCIATNSAAYNYASTTTQNGSLALGVTAATNMFNANMAHMQNQGTYSNLVVTPVVTKNNQYLTATIVATANYHTFLLSYIGINTIGLTASSSAANATPGYMDFYLLLDVSGSMGLPSTDSEQTRLAGGPTAANPSAPYNPDDLSQYPNGCTLACHFDPILTGYTTTTTTTTNPQTGKETTTTTQTPNYSYTYGYAISRNGGNVNCATGAQTTGCPTPVTNCPTPGTSACIQLRLDAVGYAVNQLLSTANTTATLPNQYRVGLYPFIRYMDPNYSPLTSSLTGSSTTAGTINYAAANLANELDTGTNTILGSGGTHFENALPAMSGVIPALSGGFTGSVGSGASATNTLPWVFFVTDGSELAQTYTSSSNSWSGSNHATTLSPASLCTNIKSRGVRIAVLYIPYQPIQNPNASFAGDEDDYANNNIPNIPAPLQACASPGFYFTANTPADIAAALQTMFKQAITSDRLTL